MSAVHRRGVLAGMAGTGVAMLLPGAAIARDAETLSFLAAGDLLGPYGDAADFAAPAFRPVADLIRGADVAFANAEGNMFDLAGFKGYTAAENGGGYPLHSLRTGRAFRDLGLDLISRANNHATDWGDAGLAASDAALDSLGLVHAGTGPSLTAARAPALLRTPKGIVALVAAASTFTGMSPAGDPFRGGGPRPGLNPLRVDMITLVTRAEMAALIAIANRIGWQGYNLPGPDAREVRIADKLYRVADSPGMTYEVNAADRDAMLAAIRKARAQADLVVFSIHAHETRSGGYEDPAPADFLPPLFHEIVDAGADIIIRHGPHEVQGVELYKGRPIFYGMGSLILDLDRRLTASTPSGPVTFELPAGWFDGAVMMTRFRGRTLRDVRVHPLLMETTAGAARGLPRLATGADARRILERIADRSRAFGTAMRIAGDTGVIAD